MTAYKFVPAVNTLAAQGLDPGGRCFCGLRSDERRSDDGRGGSGLAGLMTCSLGQEEFFGQRQPFLVGNLAAYVVDRFSAVLRERSGEGHLHRYAALQAAGRLFHPPAGERAAEQVLEAGLGVGCVDRYQPAFAEGVAQRQLRIFSTAWLMSDTVPSTGETISTATPSR